MVLYSIEYFKLFQIKPAHGDHTLTTNAQKTAVSPRIPENFTSTSRDTWHNSQKTPTPPTFKVSVPFPPPFFPGRCIPSPAVAVRHVRKSRWPAERRWNLTGVGRRCRCQPGHGASFRSGEKLTPDGWRNGGPPVWCLKNGDMNPHKRRNVHRNNDGWH